MSSVSVQLVDATTGEAFKEHHKDDKIYVEVEPMADYFIKIDRKSEDGSGQDIVIVDFKIDGTELNFNYTGNLQRPYQVGSWQLQNGESTMMSLKFGTPVVSDDSAMEVEASPAPVTDTSNGMTGSIELLVFEAKPMKEALDEWADFSSNNPDCAVDKPIADQMHMKAVRSGLGTVPRDAPISKGPTSYEKGELLETITLNYCTALGLIYAGILDQPPHWEKAQMEAPWTGHDDPELEGIKPEIVRKEIVTDVRGEKTVKVEELVLFDLTHLE